MEKERDLYGGSEVLQEIGKMWTSEMGREIKGKSGGMRRRGGQRKKVVATERET